MKRDARGKERGANYAIRIAGQLGAEWADWFGGMTIAPEANGDTLLTGVVADQAALHGLLRRVRDLGLTLLAVNLIVDERRPSPKPLDNTQDKQGE